MVRIFGLREMIGPGGLLAWQMSSLPLLGKTACGYEVKALNNNFVLKTMHDITDSKSGVYEVWY